MLRNERFSDQNNTAQDVPLDKIPQELLLLILSFTDYRTLTSLRAVSQYLAAVSLDNSLWREEFKKEFPLQAKTESTLGHHESYFRLFKHHYKLEPFHQTRITLSHRGDEIKIEVFIPGNGEIRDASANDRIHPILKTGLTCHSSDSILAFLTSINATPSCLDILRIENNALRGGGFSSCTIDKMLTHAQTRQQRTPDEPKPTEETRSYCCLS